MRLLSVGFRSNNCHTPKPDGWRLPQPDLPIIAPLLQVAVDRGPFQHVSWGLHVAIWRLNTVAFEVWTLVAAMISQ